MSANDPKQTYRFWLVRFEGGHVDGEAVLHVGLKQSLVGLVDLLDRDDFDVGGDVVLTAAMPPMGDPERLRRPKRRLNAPTARGFSGAPTSVTVPSRANRLR